MPGKIYQHLGNDHRRLDIAHSATPGETIDVTLIISSRGVLKHIGREEKILLPAAQRLRGGQRLEVGR